MNLYGPKFLGVSSPSLCVLYLVIRGEHDTLIHMACVKEQRTLCESVNA